MGCLMSKDRISEVGPGAGFQNSCFVEHLRIIVSVKLGSLSTLKIRHFYQLLCSLETLYIPMYEFTPINLFIKN